MRWPPSSGSPSHICTPSLPIRMGAVHALVSHYNPLPRGGAARRRPGRFCRSAARGNCSSVSCGGRWAASPGPCTSRGSSPARWERAPGGSVPPLRGPARGRVCRRHDLQPHRARRSSCCGPGGRSQPRFAATVRHGQVGLYGNRSRQCHAPHASAAGHAAACGCPGGKSPGLRGPRPPHGGGACR